MMNLKKTFLIVVILVPFVTFSQYDPDYNSDDEEDLSELSFKDRLFTGGNFWAQFGSITNVEIAPILGYKVTQDYSAGIGLKYSYYKDFYFSTNMYGGSVFNRYVFFDKIVAHAELEMLNLQLFNSRNSSERKWVPIGLVGGGYSANGFQIMLLYDLINNRNNPYPGTFGADSRLYLRVGFLFNL